MIRSLACILVLSLYAQCVFAEEEFSLDQNDSPRPLVAVFVPENLSGNPVPLGTLQELLAESISAAGIPVLDDESLRQFMTRHRIRHTGGIDRASGIAFKNEENVDAVLISSVELYDEGDPPKIGLISRLVSTGEDPKILWMDGSTLSGDDSPGLLGLGLITDHKILREKAIRSLVSSLSLYFFSGEKEDPESAGKRQRPRIFYRSEDFSPDKRYTIAIAPFFNVSSRKYGGDILALHFVKELVRSGAFDVIEPGVVRQMLLNIRIIMSEGISLTDAYLITLDLNADLVLAGKVVDYQDAAGSEGIPKIDFSVVAIDSKKKVLWSSKSYTQGDDGVYFFDRGRIGTAGRLASNMVRLLVGEMLKPVEGFGAYPELPYSSRPAE
jgi:hypothetical protein